MRKLPELTRKEFIHQALIALQRIEEEKQLTEEEIWNVICAYFSDWFVENKKCPTYLQLKDLAQAILSAQRRKKLSV